MSIFHMRDIKKKTMWRLNFRLKYPIILDFYIRNAIDSNFLINVQKV